ncbi:FAD-binding oxidoreductase, partial [bacterium M00.F.Ca.ET.177.01.1.1]
VRQRRPEAQPLRGGLAEIGKELPHAAIEQRQPALPDSRPVIGPSAKSPNVIYAFGHGHLGLTLAPATARWVARFIAGQDVQSAADFAPARFG